MYRLKSYLWRAARALLVRVTLVILIDGCSMIPNDEQPAAPVAAGYIGDV